MEQQWQLRYRLESIRKSMERDVEYARRGYLAEDLPFKDDSTVIPPFWLSKSALEHRIETLKAAEELVKAAPYKEDPNEEYCMIVHERRAPDSWCACMGPMYGEPLCPCRMQEVAEGWGVPYVSWWLKNPHRSVPGFSFDAEVAPKETS